MGEGLASHHRRVHDLVHLFRWSAEAGAFLGDDDGALDEDGVLLDGGEEVIIAERLIIQAQLLERRAAAAQDVANPHAHGSEHGLKLGARRGRLQIFDDLGLMAMILQGFEHIARG